MRGRLSSLILITIVAMTLACRAATGLIQPATPTPSRTATTVAEPTRTPPPTHSPAPLPSPTPLPPSVDQLLAHCPPAQGIASVDRDLKLAFEGDPTAGELVCRASQGSADLTRLQERAYQALLIMEHLSFDTPLPWSDQPLYAWFTAAVEEIRFRDDISNSFCCDPPGVINVQTRNQAALSTLRWIDPESGAGLQDLVALLVHEARHNQGYAHTCGTNDNTVAEMGAWGVQYWFFQYLAYHSRAPFLVSQARSVDYYREAARDQARWLRNNRFCAEPTLTPGPPPPLP